MVNLTTANNALKTVYLDVVDNLLNLSTNPLFAKIKKTTEGVSGKEISVCVPYGVNGGIAALKETGVLPTVGNNSYLNFTTPLKNLYGRLEISDKAVRASQNSAGAFVNLLNNEMESLVQSSAVNLSRMIYGDGIGLITEIRAISNDGMTLTVDSTNSLYEGMIFDIIDYTANNVPTDMKGRRIVAIDRVNKTVTVDTKLSIPYLSEGGFNIGVQNSYKNEITGVFALFNMQVSSLYGIKKSEYSFMKGRIHNDIGDLTDIKIMEKIDEVEESTSAKVNFISCSSAVRRKYQTLLIEGNRNVNMIDLGNGFKALDFYGIPMVSDKFVPEQCMYLLDTDCFTLHQMCDWEWLADEGGNILTQKSDYPVYTATLVKYADMICRCPNGQSFLRGITV